MRIKLLLWVAVWYSAVACASQTAHTAGQNGKPSAVRPMPVSRPVILDDRRFVELHFRETLEPLLEGFRREFGRRETSLLTSSQFLDGGTIVVRVRIEFGQEVPPLTLAETYTPGKIDRAKRQRWDYLND